VRKRCECADAENTQAAFLRFITASIAATFSNSDYRLHAGGHGLLNLKIVQNKHAARQKHCSLDRKSSTVERAEFCQGELAPTSALLRLF
jgi:hypothetical protein